MCSKVLLRHHRIGQERQEGRGERKRAEAFADLPAYQFSLRTWWDGSAPTVLFDRAQAQPPVHAERNQRDDQPCLACNMSSLWLSGTKEMINPV